MKEVDRELLVYCREIPCPWQTERKVRTCPHLSAAPRGQKGFPHKVCLLYSTPGPHAESRIAQVLGVSVSVIRRLQETAMRKLSRRLAGDIAFGHDEDYVLLMEQYFGS